MEVSSDTTIPCWSPGPGLGESSKGYKETAYNLSMKKIAITEFLKQEIIIMMIDIVLNVPAKDQKSISAKDILNELWDNKTIAREYPKDYYKRVKEVESCVLKEIRHQLAIALN